MQSLTLYEVNNYVSSLLNIQMPDALWMRAELSEVRESHGHCYLEFIQKSASGTGIVAKARGQIWASRWNYLRSYFWNTTGQPLSPGMQVLVQVRITFHELYGYALNVTDIDPTYTIGDLARRRQEIIMQLKEEGVFDMNRELPLPTLLQRIAVISAPTAAGYGDFVNQLERNPRQLSFSHTLFPALMQGDGVEKSVISALNSIAGRQDEFDVVVIIRGGGSTSDLSGFDTFELAENVAQFPLPIITGIGHERDDTILDLVAHTRVKTPTAAAEFIIHHQLQQLLHIEDLADRLYNSTCQLLATEDTRLKSLTAKLPTLVSLFCERENNRLNQTLSKVSHTISMQLYNEHNRLSVLDQRLANGTQTSIERQRHTLELLETKLQSADPGRILRLGFSITRCNGKAVTDASQLSPGDEITTTLANGTIQSTICPPLR